MKFCPNCGAKLSDGVKFCTECGTRIVVPEPPAPPVYEPQVQAAYEPPVQPAYEPQVQTAYEPPVQPAYEPPVQAAYEPPVQPVYEPPAKAAKPIREKNKKGLLFAAIGVAVIAVIVLLVSLLGGRNQGESADWGRYEAVSTEGDWIELQKKGKVILFIMDNEYEGKWTLDGETIVIEQGGDEFTGTLKNGTLEVDLVGMHYTFQKPGAAAPETDQNTAQQPADKEPEGPVTYKLISASVDGEEMSAEILDMMGGGWIVFNGDGTGTFALFGENNPITYDDTHMMAGEDKIPYTLTDSGMEFAMEDGSAFVLETTDETPVLPEPGVEEESEESEVPEDPGVPADSGLELWAGDYYGYWIIETVWETQQDWLEEDLYWDCCATVEINYDGTGTMTLWDEDFSKDDPLAQLEISVSESGEAARFCSEEGQFLGAPVEHADWLWYTDDTEYGDMFVIDGAFEAEGEDFWYCIYLRPWGVDWSDVEANDEVMPYYYYDWYLPMVEDGVTEAAAANVGQ